MSLPASKTWERLHLEQQYLIHGDWSVCPNMNKLSNQHFQMGLLKRTNKLISYAFIVASVFAALSVLPIGNWVWPFELAVQFVPQLLICTAALLTISLVLRYRFLSALLALCIVVNTIPIYLAMNFEDTRYAMGGSSVSVAWLNVQESPEALMRFASTHGVSERDIIAFTELSPTASEDHLQTLFPDMHVHLFADTGYGKRLSSNMAVLVRDPDATIRLVSRPDFTKRAFIIVDVNTLAGPLRVVAAHPTPPGSPGDMADRNRLLLAMREAASQANEYVLIGDFNVAPWSPVFRALPGRRVGNPLWQPTWHSGVPGLSLPIDHVLVSEGVGAISYYVGSDMGSDHRPLIATLEVAPH